MTRIFKYPFPPSARDTLTIPRHFKPLSIQLQNGIPTLWALVDEYSQEETYRLNVQMTGCYIEEDEDPGIYLGTVQVRPDYVEHYFYEPKGNSW